MPGWMVYWMIVRFRNYCDENKSLSKMLGLSDNWMVTSKPACKKKPLFWLVGWMDYWMIVRSELETGLKKSLSNMLWLLDG